MGKPVIEVCGLGKRYRIGHLRPVHEGLRHVINDWLVRPFRRRRDASATVEEFWALRDVSFQLQRGEVLGVIGANGSGKSTLLKILGRITEPTEGSAVLRGRVASLLEVGTGFHPELTGRENVYLNGAVLGLKKGEIGRRFDEIVDFSGVQRFIDTPVKHYSSGMFVRLAFAVAAHLDPEILLVDEVLAVGDEKFRRKSMDKMHSAARGGRTVLFVSHSLFSVRQLCTSALLLEDGRCTSYGEVAGVIAQYVQEPTEEPPTPVIDLPPGKPEAPGEALRLSVLTAAGQPRASFAAAEPWRIRLEFRLNRPAQGVVAAVGVTRTDGFPLVTFWSYPRDLPAGRYRMDADFRLPLTDCQVQFTAGLSERGTAFYYDGPFGRVLIARAVDADRPTTSSAAGLFHEPCRPSIEPA